MPFAACTLNKLGTTLSKSSHKIHHIRPENNASNTLNVIIGQEAICSDGLGRVAAVGPVSRCGGKTEYSWIEVETYYHNRSCQWAPHNVELIDPRKSK